MFSWIGLIKMSLTKNTFCFPKEVYSKVLILKTMDAFSDFMSFELKENKTHFILLVSNSKYDVDITIQNFENYLIDLCNQRENYECI